MTTIAITLDDEMAARLRERAENMGVAPEDWARVKLAEQLEEPAELGEDFEKITARILDKNAELYRRLA